MDNTSNDANDTIAPSVTERRWVPEPIKKRLIDPLYLEGLRILQDRYIFQPNPPGIMELKDPVEHHLYHVDTDYARTSDGVNIALWHTPHADKTRPFYVVFHGNRGHWADVGPRGNDPEEHDRHYRLNLLREIKSHRAGFAAVHLRGYGVSQYPNVHPSEKGFLNDIDAVIAWLDKQGIDPSRVVVLGESLGASVACMMAKRMTELGKPPAVLGMVGAFSSLAERSLDDYPQYTVEQLSVKLKHSFNSKKNLAGVSPSTYVYLGHAVDDKTTGYAHGLRLHEHAGKNPTRKTDGKNRDVYFMPLSGGHKSWAAREVIEDTMYLQSKHSDRVQSPMML